MLMAIALDAIIIFIIVFTIFRSAAKGFIRTVFAMLKFAVSVICAILFKGGLAKIIMNSGIYDTASEKLKGELADALTRAGSNISSEQMLEAFKTENRELVSIIEYMGADLDKTRAAVEQAALNGSKNIAETAAKHILEPAMESVAHILAFAAVFVAAYAALWLLERILDGIFGLPILCGINRAGGIICGVLCAALYASLFVSISKPILENPGLCGGSWDRDIAEQTYVYSYVENHNILSVFID